MIDAIHEQADLLEDELWDIAKKYYGLERTAEAVERVQQTYSNFFHQRLVERGLESNLMHEEQFEDVDTGLAMAFMAKGLVERLDDPQKALEMLAVAAAAKGAVEAFGFSLAQKDVVNGGMSPEKLASELAKRRHAENYKLVDFALNHWRENIDPGISAAKAANILVGVVPLSHKKLAAVVSKEKKKHH